MNCVDVNMLWNQAVHTNREVMANRLDIIIKNKKEKTCILIDVDILVDGNVIQKEAEKKLKYKSLYRDTLNVEPEINGHASNNQSHRHSNRRFKEKFGGHTRKTFNRFAITDM